jgi:hypothetical protein
LSARFMSPPLKLCKDCKFLVALSSDGECRRKVVGINMVTGDKIYMQASVERLGLFQVSCGRDGKHWQPKANAK